MSFSRLALHPPKIQYSTTCDPTCIRLQLVCNCCIAFVVIERSPPNQDTHTPWLSALLTPLLTTVATPVTVQKLSRHKAFSHNVIAHHSEFISSVPISTSTHLAHIIKTAHRYGIGIYGRQPPFSTYLPPDPLLPPSPYTCTIWGWLYAPTSGRRCHSHATAMSQPCHSNATAMPQPHQLPPY